MESPEFTCAGYRWKLTLNPGDRNDNGDEVLFVSLISMNVEEMRVDWGIGPKHANRRSTKEGTCFMFDCIFSTEKPCNHIYFNRESLTRALVNGTLTLEVHIRLCSDTYKKVIRPTNSIGNLMKAFLDEDGADLSFKVKDQTFPAHRIILKCHAPELAELSESFDSANPMPINDVDPGIFHFLLSMVYEKTVNDQEWKDRSPNLESILKAAEKYGFASVKTKAETWYLHSLKLDIDNVINHLLNADAYDFLLVKNASLKFILDNADEVVSSESYAQLNESPPLMKEVAAAMAKHVEQLSDKKRKYDE
jgi:hypothetical protein